MTSSFDFCTCKIGVTLDDAIKQYYISSASDSFEIAKNRQGSRFDFEKGIKNLSLALEVSRSVLKSLVTTRDDSFRRISNLRNRIMGLVNVKGSMTLRIGMRKELRIDLRNSVKG